MKDLSLIISQIRQRLEILYQEVDRLEAGGGGGGDTGNYNDLTNKPKINSVTLSGNKSLADLGIAAASTTYTKTEVDSALSGKADTSTTYTKTETDAEIQGAITDLDVPTTTETGHYVKSIAQEDGKIVAVADTVQDYASPDSTHPITSGAVASIQSTLNTNITKNATAITALIDDGPKNLANPLAAIGYNYQTAYPYESSGLTFTLNADGSITVTGTNNGSAAKTFRVPIRVKVGQSYTLSGCPSGGSNAGYQLDIREAGTNTIVAADTGSGATFTAAASTYDVCIRIATGYSVNKTFYIMVCDSNLYNYDDTFTTYIPTPFDLDAAINTKTAFSDVFGMGTVLQPTQEAPADMNNITDIGVYTCSATYIENLANRPENKTGVNLYFEVRKLTSTRWIQTAYYQSSDADCFYIRWKTVNSWTSWSKFTDVSASVFGTGTALTTGQNLNDITTLGVYNANTPTIANSLYYCPVATAFRMEVTTLNGSTRFIQKIYTVDTTTSRITVYARGYTVSGWSNWAKFEGVDAPSLHVPTT